MPDPASDIQSIVLQPMLTNQTVQPSFKVNKIPEEIWKRIFFLGTRIPGALDSSSRTPLDYSEIETGYTAFLENLDETTCIKQKIMEVCPLFFDIAKELYFEYLLLSDVEDEDLVGSPWYLIAPGLEADRVEKEANNQRGAAWYIKYLEISASTGLAPDGVDKAEAIATVLKCCPNVEVLTLGIDAPCRIPGDEDATIVAPPITDVHEEDLIPYPILAALRPNALFNRLRLRKLVWNSNIVQATNILISYLPTLINLESFHINLRTGYYTAPSAINITLEKLRTLEIVSMESDPSGFLSVVATWTLGSLLQVRAITTIVVVNPIPCFQVHGAKLITLDFDSLGSHGRSVLGLCTKLKDMIIPLRETPKLGLPLESKTVRRIGIRGTNFLDDLHFSDDVNRLFALFEQIVSPLTLAPGEGDNHPLRRTPLVDFDALVTPPLIQLCPYYFKSLHTIRLLGFDPAQFQKRKWSSRHVANWVLWETRFNKLRIKLEDHMGNPIKIPLDEVNLQLD